MKYLTTAALILTIIANAPAFAGGPVLVEDESETVALVPKLTAGEKIAIGLGILLLVGLATSGGDDDTVPGGVICYAPEEDNNC